MVHTAICRDKIVAALTICSMPLGGWTRKETTQKHSILLQIFFFYFYISIKSFLLTLWTADGDLGEKDGVEEKIISFEKAC